MKKIADEIKRQTREMQELVSKDSFTERDVFIAQEIVTRRIKSLRKLERSVVYKEPETVINVDRKRVVFPTQDTLHDFLGDIMARNYE